MRAAAYLKRRGYKIIETNYRSPFGEIDIIAQKGGALVFVEVKKRKSGLYGGGAAAVDMRKRQRIIKTAQSYIMYMTEEKEMRFDVIEILDGEISHIENAFFT